MAELPRLSPRAEHRLLRFVCNLPPRVQRLVFGAPPEIDGQVLASDVHALIRLAEFAGIKSYTNGLPPTEARALTRLGAMASSHHPPIPIGQTSGISLKWRVEQPACVSGPLQPRW